MMAVNNLDAFAPDEFCHAENEPQLERSFRRGGMEGQAQVADHLGKFTSIRASEPDLLPQLLQAMNQFYTLVVGPSAREQGVQVKNAERGVSGWTLQRSRKRRLLGL